MATDVQLPCLQRYADYAAEQAELHRHSGQATVCRSDCFAVKLETT